MRPRHVWLPLALALVAVAARATVEIGVATLADPGSLFLRGATWYKLVPGTVIEDGDIVATSGKQQLQVELAGGTILSLAGDAQLLLAAAVLTMPEGWLKAAVKRPGLRVRMPAFEIAVTEGIVVLHADANGELFVETGSARITGGKGPPRDAKRSEYWTSTGGSFASRPLAPRAFVNAMPRSFVDALPVLAPRIKSRPAPVEDHDVTYEEAAVWLVGKDRAAFERRFASRLRDPVFRRAVEPNVARYPLWDRMLHPEKYAPKPAPPVK